jgi:hypothetical protein
MRFWTKVAKTDFEVFIEFPASAAGQHRKDYTRNVVVSDLTESFYCM